jgi:hypothetical protein
MTLSQSELARFYRDPAYLVRRVLGAKPTDQQSEVLAGVARGENRMAIRSGHGIGKTALLAWLIIWFLGTRPSCLGVAASVKEDQLKLQLWAEVSRWLRKAPEPWQQGIRVDKKKIYRRDNPEDAFFIQQVCKKENVEALQGWHHPHMMILTDESSGIPDELFRPLKGALTGSDNRWIKTSNPTRRSGYFYKTFKTRRKGWSLYHFSSLDSPLVDPNFEAEIIADYGKESNQYRFMVLGEFPLQDDNALILFEDAQAAVDREVVPLIKEVKIGCDPARSADGDPTGLVARLGPRIMSPESFWTKDEMVVAGKAIEYRRMICDKFKVDPGGIYVDTIGVGAGAHDRIAELDENAVEVNVAWAPTNRGKSRKPGAPEFDCLRSQLWWQLRQFCKNYGEIPNDDDFINEITAPTYTTNSKGQLVVESKDSMRARGIKSPNKADAACLTFYNKGPSYSDLKIRNVNVTPEELM